MKKNTLTKKITIIDNLKHLLTAFIFLLSINLPAQNWAPQGATWFYSFNINWTTGYIKIDYSGDTLIADNAHGNMLRECQILKKMRYTYNFITDSYDTASIGEEYTSYLNDTVFLYKFNRFFVLYDFSAQPGNTWIIPGTYESPCDTTGMVKTVASGDTVINSETLRYIVVESIDTSQWSLQGKIIEKIGPLNYMFPEQNCIVDVMEGGPLRCYHDNTLQFTTNITPYCDYILRVDNKKEGYFNVYPNPVLGNLTVHCKPDNDYNIKLINLCGLNIRKYQKITNASEINLDGIPAGIYFILISDNDSGILINKLKIIKK